MFLTNSRFATLGKRFVYGSLLLSVTTTLVSIRHLQNASSASHTFDEKHLELIEEKMVSERAPNSTSKAYKVLLSDHPERVHMHTRVFQQESSSSSSSSSSSVKSSVPLVLVHGWGSGSALWSGCIDRLTEHFEQVYVVDLLGFGRSSRPPYIPPRSSQTLFNSLSSSPSSVAAKEQHQQTIAEFARDFFLHPLKMWKDQVFGADQKIMLLGHSLGGYIVGEYGIHYPEDVQVLFLACPVGVAPWKFTPEHSAGAFRKLARLLVWDLGVTPQGLLRAFGANYSQKVWAWIGERSNYRGLDADSWQYLYHSQLAPASGDQAFWGLLQRDGWALPLLDRMQHIQSPTRIIYAEHDYIRHEFGPTAVQHLKSAKEADYVVVGDVGHHVYVNNEQFANSIVEFSKRFSEK